MYHYLRSHKAVSSDDEEELSSTEEEDEELLRTQLELHRQQATIERLQTKISDLHGKYDRCLDDVDFWIQRSNDYEAKYNECKALQEELESANKVIEELQKEIEILILLATPASSAPAAASMARFSCYDVLGDPIDFSQANFSSGKGNVGNTSTAAQPTQKKVLPGTNTIMYKMEMHTGEQFVSMNAQELGTSLACDWLNDDKGKVGLMLAGNAGRPGGSLHVKS